LLSMPIIENLLQILKGFVHLLWKLKKRR
jgi:hypothetical protein